jgi:DNA-binding NtrC family response regulator
MASARVAVDCVVLSCFEHEFLFFASMLGAARIRLHRAETIEMADFPLLATGGTVLITDAAFLDGSWKDAVQMIENVHPLVAVLVHAGHSDDAFLSDAREQGALDVLWRPLDLGRLRSAIWRAHEITLERRSAGIGSEPAPILGAPEPSLGFAARDLRSGVCRRGRTSS